MSFWVRAYGFRGFVQLPQVNPQQLQTDSVQALYWPYEWVQAMKVSGEKPPAFIPGLVVPDMSQILRLEVPERAEIRFELNPPNRGVVVSSLSPSMRGERNFPWGPGWSLSICDAAAFT